MAEEEALFVESPRVAYRGAEAWAKLKQKNDRAYYGPDGALRVDHARWLEAQAYERDTWLGIGAKLTDASNYIYAEGFAHYNALPAELGDIVEVGCGPFTNLRLILPGRTARSVTLLDPLLLDYLEHAHCPYRDGRLLGYPLTLLPTSLESWEAASAYDTLVMINVLPHCFDAAAALERAEGALRPGGLLVWHELPSEQDPARYYDAGHPIQPRAAWLERWLERWDWLWRQDWYVIARKR